MKKLTYFTILFFLFMAFSTNSKAQTYKKGDVNQDGIVDISDVVAVINIIAFGGEEDTFPTEAVTYEVEGVQFTMIPVEGGMFKMGAISNFQRERPVHQVMLSSFLIGQTEVTQELWEAVMGKNPSEFEGSKLPVENVSWNDCQTFITKLNSMTGQQFRLPTEAEWEYAAKGGNQSKGYKYSGSDIIGKVAWYKDNSDDKTHEVATKAPNELGIYDMSGNVYEWCQDWYASDYYSSSPTNNPTGPSSGSNRVDRGGGWGSEAGYCRVAFRGYYPPDGCDRIHGLGLRLAL